MKVVISGYGRMGHIVEEVLNLRGIECALASEDIQSVPAQLAKECVCIDFTVPDAFRKNYKFIAENFKAAVVGTTGWYDIKDEVIAYFEKCGTPMVYASNFSIGVNVLFSLTQYASRLLSLAGGYSPYITEMHHCHKLDAPSGTAKSLASIVDDNFNTKTDVASVRCGEIPGIHTIGFEGEDDRIVIRHEAFSRRGFASGAVQAALQIENLKGVYEFKDIIFSDLCVK